MALGRCRKCGRVIEDSDGYCPHCNYAPGVAPVKGILLIVVAVLILVIGLALARRFFA